MSDTDSWDRWEGEGRFYGVYDAHQDYPVLLALFTEEEDAYEWARTKERKAEGFPEWCVCQTFNPIAAVWNSDLEPPEFPS